MCLACDTCVLADFKAPESHCCFQLAWYVGVDVVFFKQANVTNATSNRCTAQLWFIELMVVNGRAVHRSLILLAQFNMLGARVDQNSNFFVLLT